MYMYYINAFAVNGGNWRGHWTKKCTKEGLYEWDAEAVRSLDSSIDYLLTSFVSKGYAFICFHNYCQIVPMFPELIFSKARMI